MGRAGDKQVISKRRDYFRQGHLPWGMKGNLPGGLITSTAQEMPD